MLDHPGGEGTAAAGGQNGDSLGMGYIEANGEFLEYLRERIRAEGGALLWVLSVDRRLPSPIPARPVFGLTFMKPPERSGAARPAAAAMAPTPAARALDKGGAERPADARPEEGGRGVAPPGGADGRPAGTEPPWAAAAADSAGRPPAWTLEEAAAQELLLETWAAMEEGRAAPLSPADVSRAAAEWRFREEGRRVMWRAAARVADLAAALEGALRQRAEMAALRMAEAAAAEGGA